MKKSTDQMTTEEHQRWMRQSVDRVIGAVLVVGLAAGGFFYLHQRTEAGKRDARTIVCQTYQTSC